MILPKVAGRSIRKKIKEHPAVEDQCTDRVYRIGQAHDEVHVYYPLAVHPEAGEQSFDLNLHKLLTRKRELSHNVLASPEVTQGEFDELYRSSFGGG